MSLIDDVRKSDARGVKFIKMCKRVYVVICTQQIHTRVVGRTCTAVSVTSDQQPSYPIQPGYIMPKRKHGMREQLSGLSGYDV